MGWIFFWGGGRSGWDPIEEFSFDGLNVVFHYVKSKAIPVKGYNRCREFQEFEAPTCRKFVSLRPINFRRQVEPPVFREQKSTECLISLTEIVSVHLNIMKQPAC